MKNKISVEEQVAQLTDTQKEKIVKVGRVGMILELIVLIPCILFCLFGFLIMMDPPAGYDVAALQTDISFSIILIAATGIFCLIGIVGFIKIKYPDYSDAKRMYILKMKKENRKTDI